MGPDTHLIFCGIRLPPFPLFRLKKYSTVYHFLQSTQNPSQDVPLSFLPNRNVQNMRHYIFQVSKSLYALPDSHNPSLFGVNPHNYGCPPTCNCERYPGSFFCINPWQSWDMMPRKALLNYLPVYTSYHPFLLPNQFQIYGNKSPLAELFPHILPYIHWKQK